MKLKCPTCNHYNNRHGIFGCCEIVSRSMFGDAPITCDCPNGLIQEKKELEK